MIVCLLPDSREHLEHKDAPGFKTRGIFFPYLTPLMYFWMVGEMKYIIIEHRIANPPINPKYRSSVSVL